MEVPDYSRETAARQATQPNRAPRVAKQPVRRQALNATPWTFQDKLPYYVAILALVAVAFSVITVSNKSANAQKNLTQINQKVTNTRNNNNNLKQDIATLTNTDRLTQVAQESGLSMNVNNVRNVQ
ncbi:cell division protein FtsL [Weissella oryzae SG25]|uniref:Cell division protein FtsL n=1 Tax=Weissella oryzae (strain DSM 25784 / JCM 18191 / LMG 30913 / SG25) TaxID=1329250 RepID=A0A069CZV3_WEIOS|nr:cell division protein FtsL [Weissella oryzae]GAK30631.1 cell division protein FtsL [Weissella oryzae SG25]